MKQLRGESSDALLDEAIEALQQGETEKADRLLQKIGEQVEGHIERAAVAAFQRGRIAEDDFRYKDALQFYEDNVRLQLDNMDGWVFLGNLYYGTGELAGTNQEIEAKAFIGLGLVYQTRGELDKAVEFQEKSLALFKEIGAKREIAQVRSELYKAHQTQITPDTID